MGHANEKFGLFNKLKYLEVKMYREVENNKVCVIGELTGGFAFSHEVYGEKFYMANLEVKRLSDKTDLIPVMISDRILNVFENHAGRIVKVSGQFRSYNRRTEQKSAVELSVFAQDIKFLDEFTDYTKANHIFLDGYICKLPVYRETPYGREIADILLAVNRPYGKTDYINCIAWGRNAKFARRLNVSDHLQVEGRIQSRQYQKRISETGTEKRVAIEVSLSRLELVFD